MSQRLLHLPGAIFLLVLSVAVFTHFSPVHALLINPSAPPPGGQSAKPFFATTALEQAKKGSLILGARSASCAPEFGMTTGCAKLCLNAGTSSDAEHCVASWSDLTNVFAASLVAVRQEALTGPDVAQFQSGYVYLRGSDAATEPETVQLGVPTAAGTFSALVADSQDSDNLAGAFVGNFGVEPNRSGGLGKICLNGTGDTPTPDGKYCISSWNQITVSIANKLTLQTATTFPLIEQGNVRLTQAFQAGSVIIGDPQFIDRAYTCGDGLCRNTGSNPESAVNCPVDCEAISAPSTLTANGLTDQVQLRITTGAAMSSTSSHVVIIARSDDPNFTWSPIQGVQYTVGGTSSFAIAVASTCGPNLTCTFIDNGYGMSGGTTYYYRAFIGNRFPRFSSTIKTAQATPDSGTSGGEDDPGDLPPVRR